jgi:predicted nucleic acid-binding protein
MFPDNTALINFAIINRMDLLARLANGNGRWCATVATECAESAKRPELAALTGAAEIFGEPLFPTNAEYQDVRVLRDELAGPGDQPGKHLGEAETLAIVVRRQYACFFVTDDRDATRLAAKHRVKAVNTWLLLSVAHRRAGSTPTPSGDTCRPLDDTAAERLSECEIACPSTSGCPADRPTSEELVPARGLAA